MYKYRERENVLNEIIVKKINIRINSVKSTHNTSQKESLEKGDLKPMIMKKLKSLARKYKVINNACLI